MPGHGLDPAEGLFDPFSEAQADGVAGMARCASIDRGAAAADVPSHMWSHLHRAQLVGEVLGVIALVGARLDGPGPVGMGSIMRNAATRTAWPSACVKQASTQSPWRFSISPSPTKQSLAFLPAPFL